MTPGSQHPLRCETCGNFSSAREKGAINSNIGWCGDDPIFPNEYIFVTRHGCASNTASKSERCQHWKCTDNLKGDFRDQGLPRYYCDKSEREIRHEAMNGLWQFCLDNGVEIKHGDLLAIPSDGFFAMKLVKKIFELRHQHREREP